MTTPRKATQQRLSLVIDAMVRVGRADLLLPRTSDAGLGRTLDALAAGSDPTTPQGAALIQTATRRPKALAMFVRRNREWVLAEIAKAQQKSAGGTAP